MASMSRIWPIFPHLLAIIIASSIVAGLPLGVDEPKDGENMLSSFTQMGNLQEMRAVGQILEEFRRRLSNALQTGGQVKLANKIENGQMKLMRAMSEEDEQIVEQTLGQQQFDIGAPSVNEMNSLIRHLLYQGDMKLTLEQAEHLLQNLPDSGRMRRQAMNAKKFPSFLWARKSVPYTFHTALGENSRQLIRQALAFWADQTCLNFNEEPMEKKGSKVRVQFVRGMGCYSSVGRLLDVEDQEVSIGEGCEHFGIVTHEVAHSLGFFHEQSRWDRDQHVQLNVENILPGFEDQFWKENPESNDNQQVDYDLGSVMHYTESAFSKPYTGPVLVAKEPHNQRTMGQRIGPSFLDVLAMNRRYGCAVNCKRRATVCQNGGFPRPKDCGTCICPWGFGGQFCQERAASTECGETVESGREWQELEGQIGHGPEEEDQKNFSSCHWHIRAPEGKRVELLVTRLGQLCSPGCFYGNTELKVRTDFTKTGIRMCCADELPEGGLKLQSEGNLAVISLYTRKYIQNFQLKHRII